MKNRLGWCSIALLLLASTAWAQSGTEKAVAALEQKWLQSQQTNNPDLVAPLLADKFIETSADGKVMDKAGALAMAKAMKYTSAEYTDIPATNM